MRSKNKFGLTPQEESLCNYFVYGDEHTSGIQIASYKKAYNIFMDYFDALDDDLKEELDKRLNKVDL